MFKAYCFGSLALVQGLLVIYLLQDHGLSGLVQYGAVVYLGVMVITINAILSFTLFCASTIFALIEKDEGELEAV